MEFKEIKKKLLASEHADWFKTIEIGFSSNPSDFHKKFIGIEQFYNFLKKEISEWKEFESKDLPEPLEQSRKNILVLFEELNSYLEALVESRISVDNLTHQISSKIIQIQHHLYLANSPESFFIMNLNESNPLTVKGAHKYLINDIKSPYHKWSEDKNEIMGVLAAYEFSSGESSQIFSRKKAETKSFSNLRNDFQNQIDEITKLKEDKLNSLDLEIEKMYESIVKTRSYHNEEFDKLFSKIEQKHNGFHFEAKKNIDELESLYTDKLMLEKPVEYWEKRAIDLKSSSAKWMWATIATSIIGLIIFVVLALSLTPESLEKHIKNPAISIRWSILSVLAIALIVFLVRTFTKLTMSSYHLYRDAQERKQLTYLYLSLKSETEIPDADRHIILQSLFSRSDTGLLKEDSGPTMPVSVLDKINLKN